MSSVRGSIGSWSRRVVTLGAPKRERMRGLLRGVTMTALAAVVTIGSRAAAQEFYAGKTLSIIVGYSPGGGYDANSRLLARHIGRHIPGNPEIIVSNMPGAAGLTAIRYIDATAPKDGTAILHFNFGFITESKLHPTKTKIDFTRYNWIGSISQDLAVCLVWGGLGIHSLDQARAHGELHFGLTAVGSSSDINAKITKNIFNIPIHQVAGYPGSAEEKLAIESGELDGGCGPWSSTPTEWVQSKKFFGMMKYTPVSAPDLPPEIPYAVDIAPTPHDAQVIKLLTAAAELGRPFVASLSVPADRMQILRTAFDETMKDPAFIADARKLRLDVSPKNAEESLAIVKAIYALPEDITDAARKVMGD
jgi:tripartite-type tricarboxylate transporter receptor subunit TctC